MNMPAADLRSVFGLFATGVTVVSMRVDDEPHAMTANSFTSVSLDPPLILFCPALNTKFAGLVKDEPTCVVNVLSRTQEDLSTYFAGRWNAREHKSPPFDFVAWGDGFRLAGAMVSLRCRVVTLHRAGDHYIVVCEVEDVHRGGGCPDPLLFFGGRYASLRRE